MPPPESSQTDSYGSQFPPTCLDILKLLDDVMLMIPGLSSQAFQLLPESLPAFLPSLVGAGNARRGALLLLQAMQTRHQNKHILYMILEELLVEFLEIEPRDLKACLVRGTGSSGLGRSLFLIDGSEKERWGLMCVPASLSAVRVRFPWIPGQVK